MKAVRIHQFGSPDVISFEDVEAPEPGAGEVLVRVNAAGVGPWDSWVRSGKSVLPQPLPLTLGSDLSGTVRALGQGVRGFQVGQAVYGVSNARFTGAYAEYAAASAAMLATKPRTLGDVEAASVPVVAVTALQMLFEHGALKAGQRVLVHGAGGSVGAFAAQLALASGAHVTATDLKQGADYAQSLGVSRTIDVQSRRFEDEVEPVDLVIDTVGGEVQQRSFAVLKRGGRLISSVSKPSQTLAAEHGVEAKFMLVAVTTAALGQIAELVDAGKLKTRIGPVLPLSEARRAHEMLDGLIPRVPGKIVLAVTRQQ